jgi:H+/Cl- antiporter ClcA
VLTNVVDRFSLIAGNFTVITTQLIDYLPSLIIMGFGFTILIKDTGHGSTTPIRLMLVTGIIGSALSGLFFELNADSIWINDVVTASFTITDLQLVIVIASLIAGMIIGLSSR